VCLADLTQTVCVCVYAITYKVSYTETLK